MKVVTDLPGHAENPSNKPPRMWRAGALFATIAICIAVAFLATPGRKPPVSTTSIPDRGNPTNTDKDLSQEDKEGQALGDAVQAEQRAQELLNEGRARDAALVIDQLLHKYPNTEAAARALYTLEIITHPSGVRVTNIRTGLVVGVTGEGPFLFHMKPDEVVRLRFEKAGYRSVTRDVKDKTLGRMVVELTK